jgi:hypothetical protein
MEQLNNRLSMLKVLLNSHYSQGKIVNNIYEESYKIRKRIHTVKIRKSKIKNLFNER